MGKLLSETWICLKAGPAWISKNLVALGQTNEEERTREGDFADLALDDPEALYSQYRCSRSYQKWTKRDGTHQTVVAFLP